MQNRLQGCNMAPRHSPISRPRRQDKNASMFGEKRENCDIGNQLFIGSVRVKRAQTTYDMIMPSLRSFA